MTSILVLLQTERIEPYCSDYPNHVCEERRFFHQFLNPSISSG